MSNNKSDRDTQLLASSAERIIATSRSSDSLDKGRWTEDQWPEY